jgi:hypothetical protein
MGLGALTLDVVAEDTGSAADEKEQLMQQVTTNVWTYREGILMPSVSTRNVVGYGVEARDGSIGKVDEATYEVGSSYLVVDTGPWIFGKKVMLPAGVIQNVDHESDKIFVERTKDEIKNAPEFEDSFVHDEDYRARLGSYYGA